MGCCETYVGRAGDGLARENLTVARRDARPVRRLPDVESYDDFRPSRWCHGGILQSVGRLEALPATPTLPGRGARAQQFLSVVRSGERLRWQRPPALFGAGADGHSEAPDRRPLGACPYRRQCAECSPPKFIGGLSQTVMGRCRCLLPIGVILRILDWTAMCGGYEGLHRLERPSGRAGALATSAQAMSKDLGVEYRKNLGGLFDMVDVLRHPISWSPRIWSGSCSPVPNV